MEYKVDLSMSSRTVTIWTLTPEESWSPKQVEEIKRQLAEYGNHEANPRSVVIQCATVNEMLKAYASARTMKI